MTTPLNTYNALVKTYATKKGMIEDLRRTNVVLMKSGTIQSIFNDQTYSGFWGRKADKNYFVAIYSVSKI